jgi:hypothetical protein
MNETDHTQDENYVGLTDLAATLMKIVAQNTGAPQDVNRITTQADKIADTVVAYAIRRLKRMTDCRLPGDDRNLKNVWEEICVQVQGDESLAWHDYVDVIETILVPAVAALEPAEKELVWLETDAGRDWKDQYDECAENDRDPDISGNAHGGGRVTWRSLPVDAGEIANFLKDRLLAEAEDFANENIRRYLVGRISD